MIAHRILVVDDEPDVEALVTQRFRRRGRAGELEFRFAGDGQQALDMLMADPGIDIVLADINMPRMDGLTLLQRLEELALDLKTVIVSAYGDMRNIRTAMNRGAFDFVTKPIEFGDLEATLTRTLEHLAMLRRLRADKLAAERAAAALSRYFSPNMVETLSRQPDCLTPHGEWREATFLFTDLADFTPLADRALDRAIELAADGATIDVVHYFGMRASAGVFGGSPYIPFELEEDVRHLVWSIHHLLVDGWSVGLLLEELFTCYAAFAINWSSLQYADHAFTVRHVHDGAWNLRVPRPVELLFLHYHHHKAHHQNPQVPWLHLPKYVDFTEPRPSFFGIWLRMWRGPRRWPADGGEGAG